MNHLGDLAGDDIVRRHGRGTAASSATPLPAWMRAVASLLRRATGRHRLSAVPGA